MPKINEIVLPATSGAMPIIVSVGHVYILLHKREKNELPLSMAVGNKEVVHENVIRQRNRGRRYEEKCEYGK